MRTLFTAFTTLVLAAGILQSGTVLAHHSRAGFESVESVEMRGTITKMRWGNPHIFIYLARDDGEEWVLEGHSIPGAIGIGWEKDTFKEGDQIRLAGYPAQNSEKKYALIDWIITADGVAMRGFPQTVIPENLVDIAGPGQLERGQGGGGPVVASTDFTGNWRSGRGGRGGGAGAEGGMGGEGGMGRGRGPDISRQGPAPVGELTALGQQLADTWSAEEDPQYRCIMPGFPRVMTGLYGYRFVRFDDRLEMSKELPNVNWTIWLDETTAPKNAERSHVGLSIGHMVDDNTMEFETTNFSAEPWGHGRGVDSSEQKTVSTRFELQPDGLSFTFTATVTDPVYLAKPRVITGTMSKRADRVLDVAPCDPELSSLHLNSE